MRFAPHPLALGPVWAVAAALLLGACGKNDTPSSAPLSSPSVTGAKTEASGLSSPSVGTPITPIGEAHASAVPVSGSTALGNGAAAQIATSCADSATTEAGQYMAENNSWGKAGVVGWSQCMGVQTNARGGISARWTWDWKQQGDNVKAYPEVVFGHKPGYPNSTTTLLPRKLKELQTLVLDYDVAVEREGAGNMAIDMWLTSSASPTTFAVPPITHEVMIWLEVYGPMYAGGQQVDKVRINGTTYRVYVGEKFGLGWRYVAFAPNSPMLMSRSMNLMPFFEYLKGKNLITTDEHLAAVNLGNEIISGAGETQLNHFAVRVK